MKNYIIKRYLKYLGIIPNNCVYCLKDLEIEKLKINPPFEKMQKYLHTIVNKVQFINDFEYEIYFNI